MTSIKVSIIVPVYNTEKYLPQCLDSLLSQTLREIEILCIDNGSTDSSGSILERYSQEDTRIHVFHLPKSSIGTARNYGIDAACGKYIGFVDSDDFIDSHMYENLYMAAEKNHAEIAITNITLFYNDTHQSKVYRDSTFYSYLEMQGSFSVLEFPKIVQSVGIWDKLYSHDFLTENRLLNPENTVYEDHLFSFQALLSASRLTVVNQPMYYYRKDLILSVTGQEKRNDTYKMDFLKICHMIRLFMIKKGVYSPLQNEFALYEFNNALWHQSNIAHLRQFQYFFKEMKHLLPEDELRIARKFPDRKLRLYALVLQYNLVFPFFLLCRARKKYKRNK